MIASSLSLSPPTSGLGLVLIGRVHEAKPNWHAHVIRSLLETGFWISVVGFTYFRGDVESTEVQRLIIAVAWGTLSGVSVVLLGDSWERYLSRCGGIRVVVKVDTLKNTESELKQHEKINNKDAFASLGAFSLLYIFFFVGYHTLSFIFLLPYTMHHHGYNFACNLFLLYIFLATLAGVTFTATATILVRISSTENLGRVLLGRVTSAGVNWRYRTKRSAFEVGTWLLIVCCSFHVRYFGWNALWGNGQFCSSSSDCGSEFQEEALRATWAVVWALQRGTIVASALVLGEHYLYEKKESIRNVSRAKIAQVKRKKIAPTVERSPCQVREKARKEGLILYDGDWYSVGKFVPHHPGGAEILEQYLGTDISFVFRVMHRNPNNIMKYRKPVRIATCDELEALTKRRQTICNDMMEDYQRTSSSEKQSHPKLFDLESFEKDAIKLWEQFVELGYFKPSRVWIVRNTIVLFSLLASSISCMKILPPSWYLVPGVLLGLFWHQSGYLMHDAEHHNLAGNEVINDVLGWLYGTVCLGVNGAWWREEHREHHAFLNTYDGEGFKDPQVRCLNKCVILFLMPHLILLFSR